MAGAQQTGYETGVIEEIGLLSDFNHTDESSTELHHRIDGKQLRRRSLVEDGLHLHLATFANPITRFWQSHARMRSSSITPPTEKRRPFKSLLPRKTPCLIF
jgi:hypothetical protein